MPGRSRRPPLDRVTRFAFAMSSVPVAVRDVMFNSFLFVYYSQVLGLNQAVASVALLVGSIFDAFFDPLLGWYSDRSNCGRLGRRHPFLYGSIVPTALCSYLLWVPPSWVVSSPSLLATYLLVFSMLLRISLSFFEVPTHALAPELVADYDQRTALLTLRNAAGFFAGLGLLYVTTNTMLTPTRPGADDGVFNLQGYNTFGLVCALSIGLFSTITAIGTHKRIPYLATASTTDDEATTSDQRRSVLSTARLILSSNSLTSLLACALFSAIGEGLGKTLDMIVLPYFWRVSIATFGKMMGLSAFIAIPPAVYLTPYLPKWCGSKRNAVILLACFTIGLGVVPYTLWALGLIHRTEEDKVTLAVLFLQTQSGMMSYAMMAALYVSMNADVVEDVALRTGLRLEGVLMSVQSFVRKSVSGLGTLAGGLLLHAVAFPTKARPGEVADDTVIALVRLYLPATLFIGGLSIWMLRRYDIDRAAHEANLAELERREQSGRGRECKLTSAAEGASPPVPPRGSSPAETDKLI